MQATNMEGDESSSPVWSPENDSTDVINPEPVDVRQTEATVAVRRRDEDRQVAEAIRLSLEAMSSLDLFRAEHDHEEKRALAEAIRLSRDLQPLDELNVVPPDDGRAEYVEALIHDLMVNPQAAEFGDASLAGLSAAQLHDQLTAYQRIEENTRLAALEERAALEARLLNQVPDDLVERQRRMLVAPRRVNAVSTDWLLDVDPDDGSVPAGMMGEKGLSTYEEDRRKTAALGLCSRHRRDELVGLASAFGLEVSGSKETIADRIAEAYILQDRIESGTPESSEWTMDNFK